MGKGSLFVLTLPKTCPREEGLAAPVKIVVPERPSVKPSPVRDDRENLDGKRHLLLVVEDDVAFADVVTKIARDADFHLLVAHSAEDGIRLAREYVPHAIILDIGLPDHSGLSVLDRLKRDAATRHVPVHVVSAFDHAQPALKMGAIGYLLKPAAKEELASVLSRLTERLSRRRRLLVVEDDASQRAAIVRLLDSDGVDIVAAASVAEAFERIRESPFDCMVTDLTLPDASGYDLLEKMAREGISPFPPVVVYTGRSLSEEEEQWLRRFSSSIIVKGARSPERLLDEVTLFLHQVEAELPPERQQMLRQVRERERVFEGRKILLAEDDVRNVFALTSVLEPKGAELVIARSGRQALEQLERVPDIALVLMDIMMPEMDGLTAIQEIRGRGGDWSRLPIIALTAKAMRDDQERCLTAGASDYVAKPLDIDMLLSLIRVWLPPA